MNEFDRERYLNTCRGAQLCPAEDLALVGVVLVLLLSGLDLLLTLAKIAEGPFMDANPIAQMLIQNGLYAALVVFKCGAAGFFAWICLKNRHLLTTQIGVGIAFVAHALVSFHWVMIF